MEGPAAESSVTWWHPSRRQGATIAIVGAVAAALIMVLSSALPPADSWHSEVPPQSALNAPPSPPPSQISAFYPYLANPQEYPVASQILGTQSIAPVVLASSSSCSGPTALSIGSPVQGSLSPNGCAIYTFSLTQATWVAEERATLTASETDELVGPSQPVFTVYEDLNATPSPANWLEYDGGPNASAAVHMASSPQGPNVQGGWGTYEYAVVSGPSSYGTYCFEVNWGGYDSCSAYSSRIGITGGTSSLVVKFTAVTSGGSSPYNYSWKFGDGKSGTAQDPSHTYSAGGAYGVTLSVKDGAGKYSNTSMTIGVQPNSGNFEPTYPHLASAVVNGVSTYLLAESTTGPSGISTLVFSEAVYNSSLAAANYGNGEAGSSLPLVWSPPVSVASFATPVTSDAIATSPSGNAIALAASANGSTWVFESVNGGSSWRALSSVPLVGAEVQLALGTADLLATTVSVGASAALNATTFSLNGEGMPHIVISPGGASVLSAAPVYSEAIASGVLGIAVTTAAGGVYFYRSNDDGHEYSSASIGSFTNSSAPIFNSIGDTRLDDSRATAGNVTATADGPDLFVLYTSNVAGRTEANVTSSGNSGLSWGSTASYQLPDGSIGQPYAEASPVGYVYVTWTDDSQGPPGVDQAVFSMDGRVIQGGTELPGTGGSSGEPDASPTVAVDASMRPLYVWFAGGALEGTGAFLAPSNALSLLNASFRQLTAWDLKPSALGGTSDLVATVALFNSLAGRTGNLTSGGPAQFPTHGPCGLAAEQGAAATLYGEATPFPFAYVNTSGSDCADVAPALKPASNVTGYGPTAPGTYLSVLGDWLLESEGVDVGYAGNALVSALDSAESSAPANLTLPPVPGKATTVSDSATVGGQSATYTINAYPLNPTTGVLFSNVSFPSGWNINHSNGTCTDTSGRGTWLVSNSTGVVSYSWPVTVEGQSHTYSSSVANQSWNLPSEVFLTNLTPNSGIDWSTGAPTATYDRYYTVENTCTGNDKTTSEGFYSDETIPSLSGTLYTNLSMVPSGPGNTFVEISQDQTPPTLDANEPSGAYHTTGGVSSTFSTDYQYELVVAFVVVATTSGAMPSSISCSDSAGLGWHIRAAKAETANYPGAYEIYADADSSLTADKLTCTPDSGTNNLAMEVYSVHGADLNAPFDNSPSLPVYDTINNYQGGTPSVDVATNVSNDLVFGMLGCFGNQTPEAGTGLASLGVEHDPPTEFTEYEVATYAGNHTVTTQANPCGVGGNGLGMTLIGDAIDGGYESMDLAWQNTMRAEAHTSYSSTDGWSDSLSSNAWSNSESFVYGGLPAGPGGAGSINYTVSISVTSQGGSWNSTQKPSVSAGEDFSASPLTSDFGCSFPLEPNDVRFAAPPTVETSQTSNKATMTWESNVEGPSWAGYFELGTGINWTQTASMNASGNPSFPYEYSVELQGLPAVSLFGVTAWTSFVAVPGCVSYVGDSSTLFLTPGALPLTEADQPYDSIAQQGGGASIGWTVSPGFVSNGTLLNGTVFYNSTVNRTTVIAPIASVQEVKQSGATFAYNLSLPALNITYTAWLELNYSIRWIPGYTNGSWVGNVTLYSEPVVFDYERDTSGDGLTNLEKILGWTIPVTSLAGTTTDDWVTADPEAYATNGLVSDYIEKEYDLNPNTVDTAGSHMLDTWNLTFNLGAGGGVLPTGSDFEIWYENSTYKPFATSVEYSPGLYESGNPLSKNITNISAAGKVTSGDGAPWAARALWSYSALETFVTLPGVRNASWLRAIEGSWKGIATLTIEGKLSWGANPLAASTPGDGIPDGERVSPLYDVGLEFHSVDANQSGLSSGTGYAVLMGESYYSDSGTSRSIANYSSQGLVGNASIPTVSNYVTTFPVTQTQRTQLVNLMVVANESGSATAVRINGSQLEVSVNFDLVTGSPVTVRDDGNGTGARSTLFGVFREVPMGAKAPTWLWVPTDNATVNGLPVGLERYTGEQSFDLVVVNASSALSSDVIPLPWGGSAPAVTLSAGMNDFLVPREQFLYSPFGQAIFLGKSTGYNASNGAPPLIGSAEQTYLTGFDGSNLMVDLGSYWQDRAIAAGPGNITGSTETGTAAGNPLEIQVMAAASATSANDGGLPADPALYSTVGNPSALQSIVTLNITNTATLDLLFAALIDNTTGGSNAVNGTLQAVTNQVGFLGLHGAVVTAISNATEPNDGLYGAPASHFPPPPPPSGWGAFWNAVTSFATNPLGTVLSLVSVVWNAATAAFTYLDHLVHEAVSVGAEVVARTAAAIVHVGNVIEDGLAAFLTWIANEVRSLFAPLTVPLERLAASYYSALNSSMDPNASAFGAALSGPFFLLALGLAAVTEIALAIVTPLSLGTGFLVSILISLLITVALSLASSTGAIASLNSVTSFGPQIVRDMQSWVNGTSASADVKLPSRYNQLASIFSALAGAAVLPFSVGLLARGLGYAGGSGANNPLIPVLAFVLGVIDLVLHFVYALDQVPVGLLILGAIVGGMAAVLASRALQGEAAVEWRIMAGIDLGLAVAGTGATVYEILSEP
jgi:PKD domain